MAKKKCELCDGVAAASPRRSIATTTARPVGFALRLLPSSIAVSALNQVTIAKKKVEDVTPIATGHEKEELEAELEGRRLLNIDFPEGKVILESAILTTVVVLSLTVYTFWAAKRGYDFNFLGPFLFGALIVLIVFAMIQVMPLIPNSMP
ncbi:hypothetical protein DY000_02050491 [Brassica cretica]|uniref:Uncharacterized protein n=1 Tax=Brassica cretica TaxID=69181 RepID=A0ABQ7EXZ8_BRACR|nr:hypothetical protein DY000_02050491 [Brassica cretica]